MVDAAFRIPLVGLYAAVIQAFVGAEPMGVFVLALPAAALRLARPARPHR
jgi:hypothetical protein